MSFKLFLCFLFVSVFQGKQVHAQIACDPDNFVIVGNDSLFFAGSSYDADANQTSFFYCIKSGAAPAISHVMFSCGGCSLESLVSCNNSRDCSTDLFSGKEVTESGSWRTKEDGSVQTFPKQVATAQGCDGSTGICGLKFDQSFRDNGEAQYYFSLNGEWETGSISFISKASTDFDFAVIPGPACSTNEFDLPEPPGELLLSCQSEIPEAEILQVSNQFGYTFSGIPSDSLVPGSCPNSFEIFRSWTFEDQCGERSSIYQKIKVEDKTPPVPPATPSNITLSCDAEIPLAQSLIAQDNCEGEIVADPVDRIFPGSCPNSYVLLRSWTFTDACGNSSRISQSIRVEDQEAPELPAAPADTVVSCVNDIPAPQLLTALDNCGESISVLPTESQTSNNCLDPYTLIRSWTFTDACGNSSRLTQRIQVGTQRSQGPPADMVLDCTAEVPAAVSLNLPDACEGLKTVIPVEETLPGNCPNSYNILRKWAFTDLCGNDQEFVQQIRIEDRSAPVPPAAPSNITISCDDELPLAESLIAQDNCDGEIVADPVDRIFPGSCRNSYVLLRSWTFTDACGNSSRISQSIRVEDQKAPELPAAPADTVVSCINDIPAPQLLTALDNCGESISVLPTESQTSNNCLDPYTLIRSWTFTDACGNSSRLTQQIQVGTQRSQGPPADMVLDCTAEVPAAVSLNLPDACEGLKTVIPVEERLPGNCPNSYSILRKWAFTDLCGNDQEFVQQIRIEDRSAPVPPAAPSNITISCDDELPLAESLIAQDNCEGEIVSEAVDRIFPGSCRNSYVLLRSWTFTDACGNSSRISQSIRVEDQKAPELPAVPADTVVSCINDIPAPQLLTALDNCGESISVLPTESQTSNNCLDPYILIRSWTFTDACGNSSRLTQRIQVGTQRSQRPPADMVLDCTAEVPAAVSLNLPDACEGLKTVIPVEERLPGNCPNSYSVLRKWAFTDLCGNDQEFVQRIRIEDRSAPVPPAAPANITISCDAEIPAGDILRAQDDCDGVVEAEAVDRVLPGNCPNSYVILRRWTFADACGNISLLNQRIQVEDKTAPEIVAEPEDVEICEGQAVFFIDPETEDACGDEIKFSYLRLDGQPLSAPYEVGNTLIRVFAQDACGNTSAEKLFSVIVNEKPVCSISQPSDIICGSNSPNNRLYAQAYYPIKKDAANFQYKWRLLSGNWGINGSDSSESLNFIPDEYPAVFELTVIDENSCQSTCSISLSCTAADGEYCSFTQGYYGNKGGFQYGQTTLEIIQEALGKDINGDGQADALVLGLPGRSLTIDQSAAHCIISALPGNGTPAALPANLGDFSVNAGDCNFGTIEMGSDQRIANNLLTQSIALMLNTRYDPALCFLKLEEISCKINPINLPVSLQNGANVCDLIDLSNRILGGDAVVGISAGEMAGLLGIVNESFVECKNLDNVCKSDADGNDQNLISDVKLETFPNPANEEFVLELDAMDYQGMLRISVRNSFGQEVFNQELSYEGEKLSHSIHISDWPEGIYQVYVIFPDAVISKSITVI